MTGVEYVRLRRFEVRNGPEATEQFYGRKSITIYRGIAAESTNVNPSMFAPCWCSEHRKVAESYANEWARKKGLIPLLLIVNVPPSAIVEGYIENGNLKIGRYDPTMVLNIQIIELE